MKTAISRREESSTRRSIDRDGEKEIKQQKREMIKCLPSPLALVHP